MRTLLLRSSLLSLCLVLAACAGGGGATRAPTVAPQTPQPATAAPATATAAAPATSAATPQVSAPAGATTVMLATTELGQIVVDGMGMTLYGLTRDEAGEPTCNDDCAQNWPPLLAPADITVGEGLDDGDFTAVARTDDAGDQVKFGQWPLYHFAGDSAPGDTNGQGVSDVWFVVGADGELIMDAP